MTIKEKEFSDKRAGELAVSLTELFFVLEIPLLRFAQQVTHDEESAQDIVQDAFYRLHQRWEQVKQPRPWLYRTVHNLAIDHYRRHKKVVHLDPDLQQNTTLGQSTMPNPAETDSPGLMPDEALEQLERIGLCRCFLEAMEEPAQSVVRLKFEENLSYRQIADNTGLSISNVGYILHHALKTLSLEFVKAGLLE